MTIYRWMNALGERVWIGSLYASVASVVVTFRDLKSMQVTGKQLTIVNEDE
jgi:hypothetical protein